MPKRRRTQLSQASTSTQMEVDDYFPPITQGSQASQSSQANTSLTEQEHLHHVSNVVKYILAADQSKIPINKSNISKAVNCHGKGFKYVMETAEKNLLDIFGFKVVDTDNKIMLINAIDNDFYPLEYPHETENRYTILFLVLAHIYMSGESCTEDSLYKFFKKLDLIIDGNHKDEVFGNLYQLIYTEFAKERYILVVQNENNKEQKEIKWGDRAWCEITPKSILQFMSMVYDGRRINTWRTQYEAMIKHEQETKEKNVNATQSVSIVDE